MISTPTNPNCQFFDETACRVSVVLPAHNAEQTVLAAIASVRNQTIADLELIIIDDGSTDATLEKISGVADSRLKIFSIPNSGPAASRNRGVRHAKGEFIAFIDADDIWLPEKLEKQLSALKKNAAAAVAYSWTDYISFTGKFVCPDNRSILNGNVYEELLRQNFIDSGSNIMVRKTAFEAVGGFDETLPVLEDWDLYLKLAFRYPFVCIPMVLLKYRLSATSLTTRVLLMEKTFHRFADRAFSTAPKHLQGVKCRTTARFYEYLTGKATQGFPSKRNGLIAIRFFRQALRSDPSNISSLWRSPWVLKALLKAVLCRLLPARLTRQLVSRELSDETAKPVGDTPRETTAIPIPWPRSGFKPNQPIFSIIIPTCNRPRQLSECLESIAVQTYPAQQFEVIVIDDGSKTPIASVAASFSDRLRLTLITQQNQGPSSARNAGAEKAIGRFLAFTDDDCSPAPDWLQKLEKQFAFSPEHMIGGQTINAITGNPYSVASQELINYLYEYYNDDPHRARFLTSNNIAVPAIFFHNVGGFDTDYPGAAAEDRDFCDRWRSYGYGIIYASEVIVQHRHHLNPKTFWQQHFGYGCGAWRFHKKRADRSVKPLQMEPLSFYIDLILYPLLKKKNKGAPFLAALMFISQLSNATGFFWKVTKQAIFQKD